MTNIEIKAQRAKEYYKKDPQRYHRNVVNWQQRHPEKANENARKWREDNPEKLKIIQRRAHLKSHYGITPEDWNLLFESQGRKCAICSTNTSGGIGWHTDHLKGTKKVRGILCNKCNVSLHDGDTPELLRKKADYLEQNGYYK